MLARLRREERGDIIVTPAVLALLAFTTLVLGGVTFFATRSVAPSVTGARQGITLDDDGNVVEGALGVVPVKTEKPEPTPSPTPRIVEHTTVVEEEPAPAQTQQPSGGVIIVNPTDDGHTEEGTTTTHNSGDDSSDGGHTEEPCCQEEDPHPN
jgi:hypothetical protein